MDSQDSRAISDQDLRDELHAIGADDLADRCIAWVRAQEAAGRVFPSVQLAVYVFAHAEQLGRSGETQ